MTSPCFIVMESFLFLNKFKAYFFAQDTHSLDFFVQNLTGSLKVVLYMNMWS